MSRPQNNENLMSLADQIVWAAETYGRGGIFDFELPNSIQQGAPVNGTWYTVHDEDDPQRVHMVTIIISDTGENLEIEFTISGGTPIVHAFAGVADVGNTIMQNDNPTNATVFDEENINPEHRISYLFDCKSLLVRIRKTSANGVGDLNCKVQWGKLVNPI